MKKPEENTPRSPNAPRTPRDLRTERPQSAAEVFRIPLLLGLASACALVAGLMGDGLWDALCWLGLALPLAAIAAAWLRRE